MMSNYKFFVRKGHLGDVILSEPIARATKSKGYRVALVTEYVHAGILLPVYDKILPYSYYTEILNGSKDEDYTVLAYELHPDDHYIDGYAKCADIDIQGDRMPLLKRGFQRLKTEAYCLIAPHTSYWAQPMREWEYSRYEELGQRIKSDFVLETVFLDLRYSFEEMLGLIEHCSIFVGNDSGPGIIAQAFSRPSLILFGATDPNKVLFSKHAKALVADVGCNGCRQWSRDSRVICNTPLCMSSICVEFVLEQMSRIVSGISFQ
jgi:hypothetical protein